MFARTSIFLLSYRANSVLQFGNSYVKSKPANCFQKTGPEIRLGSMGNKKKQKTVLTRLWRPVSTQASSVDDVTIESENGGQLQEVHCKTSSSFSNTQEATVAEVTQSAVSSTSLDSNVENKVLEGESVLSMEKHSLSIEVGASLIRFIKGKGGFSQKKFEEEMGVKIFIPSSKEEESIIIEGSSIDSVTRASEKIQAIVEEAINSPSLNYSHFISLPLAIHPELVDKLVKFQNSILGTSDSFQDETVESDSNEDTSDNEDKDKDLRKGSDVAVALKVEDDNYVKVDLTSMPLVSYAPKASKSTTLSVLGIDKSIFTKPKAFHLTVLMLKLWNKKRIDAATEVLKDMMRGSMAKARVLYATVEEVGNEDRLLRACQVITDAFVEAGLVLDKDAKQKLKLHATVMNTSHRRGKKWRRKNDSFDARGIFKQFGSEEWGEYLIREAHLSQRFVYDENGYYHCCASIPFPESMQVD
uniref:K Homology domain-containing protein n=1 Tax=Manihot esculenta TaxID=3983 RepID=A0A2C9UY65_MANES